MLIDAGKRASGVPARKHESEVMMHSVAIFSGGLDSTVLLYELLAQGDTVAALSVDYGQRHRIELAHA
ncbi:MAG: 7-cyano-7-deazaguanine synthase, partial [Planctomycetales bacterium]|nr:7-cyano-7-deazaguanine synthase [Planctomycetales bacterium]MCA9225526.1 7-cyano-7-deazaguanine synthase [Planctomycetales bacterium]